MIKEDSLYSSKNVNEFNREDESNTMLPKPTMLQKTTSWLIFLCPLLFLAIILAISITVIVMAASIDDTLLKESSITTTSNGNTQCKTSATNLKTAVNFVLYNFISFRVISSLNLLLSIVGLIMSIGYIFFYYKLRIQKRHVFGSPAIPQFLVILSGFVIFFCILQCTLYWINEKNIDNEVLSSVNQINSVCYTQTQLDSLKKIKSFLTTETNGLYGLVLFLFIWSLVFWFFWTICYAIKRFYLKEDIYRRPI